MDGPNRASIHTEVAVEARFRIGDPRFCLRLCFANAWFEKDVFGASVPANTTADAFFVIYFRWHPNPPKRQCFVFTSIFSLDTEHSTTFPLLLVTSELPSTPLLVFRQPA